MHIIKSDPDSHIQHFSAKVLRPFKSGLSFVLLTTSALVTNSRLAIGLAIALASVVGVPTARAADNGQCPAWNAASVDNKFLEWSNAVDFDASTATRINCVKLEGQPRVLLYAEMPDFSFFKVLVNIAPWDPTVLYATGIDSVGYDNSDTWAFTPPPGISVPEAYVCRAELLRSFTWRQTCAQASKGQPSPAVGSR
jgi:hypothetical protein